MYSIYIPESPSALITIFSGEGGRNEFVATLAVDAHTSTPTPVRKCVRVDINAFSGLSCSLGPLLHLLRSLEPLFPGTRHLVGVLEDRQEGRIIFLPKPRETESANGAVTHDVTSHRP